MRTTLDLDAHLLEEALKVSDKKTKTSTVNAALATYIQAKKLRGLLGLEGKIDIQDNWAQLERLELKEQRSARRRRR